MDVLHFIFLSLLIFFIIIIAGLLCLFFIAKHRAHQQLQIMKTKLAETKSLADTKIKNLKTKINKANILNASKIIDSEPGRQLTHTISNSVLKYFNEIGQEFNGLIIDQSESILRDVQFFLNEKIWDTIQEFKEKFPESPTVLPPNTRIAYTKGIRTVILIEQEPQIRSILFDESLVGDEPIKIKSGLNYRYNLSFPYVYMFLVFDNGKFVKTNVYFRNKSLNSIREHVYCTPLPNIYANDESVCMGNDNFTNKIHEESTVSKQTNKVITEFWQRTFNGHLEGLYEKNYKENIDKRIKNFSTWHQNTELDSLFILNVNWKNGVTIKGVIERILNERHTENRLDYIDSAIKDLLTKTSSTLSNHINDSIKKAANVKLEEETANELSKAIVNKMIVDHTNMVFNDILKEEI